GSIASPTPVIMEFAKTGALEYSTFFGGGKATPAAGDNSRAIWDDGTHVWLTGFTSSSGFPNIFQSGYYSGSPSGSTAASGPFIVEFNAVANGGINAGSLVWSTWIGSGPGIGYDICADAGNVYLT